MEIIQQGVNSTQRHQQADVGDNEPVVVIGVDRSFLYISFLIPYFYIKEYQQTVILANSQKENKKGQIT